MNHLTTNHVAPEVLGYTLRMRECPFCNSPYVYLFCGPSPHITCGECGADGPPAPYGMDTGAAQRYAIQQWNMRGA